ncbi:secretion system protein, partial [Saccharothrix hoggarensis]
MSLLFLALALLVLPSPSRAAARVRTRKGKGRKGKRRPGSAADPLELAATWDLLAAALRAGLPVAGAVRAVVAGVPGGAGERLREVVDLLTLGADPVHAWAKALRHPDTAPLARAARRTASTG